VLQAKILRLTESAPAIAAAGDLLEQLKQDNASLHSDNERLLTYVETLESTSSGGMNSGVLPCCAPQGCCCSTNITCPIQGFLQNVAYKCKAQCTPLKRPAHSACIMAPTDRFLHSKVMTKKGCACAGTPRGHHKLLENFVQLKADNKLLAEENARLEAELAEVQHARGGITTIPVPGDPPTHSHQRWATIKPP
jgi:chaperonin cofactor prefoldin